MRSIFFLYAELNPYNVPVFRALTKMGYCLYVIHWDHKKLTPYIPPHIDGVNFLNRSEYDSKEKILGLVEQIQPCIVCTSGWMDPVYNAVAKQIRKRTEIPVIAMIDTQWKGGKQWLNVIFSRFRHRKWFSHILVAGLRQYNYAKMLGFSNQCVLNPSLSADVELFSTCSLDGKKEQYPRQFIYIGRLSEEKGLKELIEVWKELYSEIPEWKLLLVGDGPMRMEIETLIKAIPSVTLSSYQPQDRLVEMLENSGCFILPSRYEPWALVIHEAACAGLPIICTNVCGAVDHFFN